VLASQNAHKMFDTGSTMKTYAVSTALLAAVKLGSRNCQHGMGAEVETATGLGARRSEVIPFDGAGSDDRGRTTPPGTRRSRPATASSAATAPDRSTCSATAWRAT